MPRQALDAYFKSLPLNLFLQGFSTLSVTLHSMPLAPLHGLGSGSPGRAPDSVDSFFSSYSLRRSGFLFL